MPSKDGPRRIRSQGGSSQFCQVETFLFLLEVGAVQLLRLPGVGVPDVDAFVTHVLLGNLLEVGCQGDVSPGSLELAHEVDVVGDGTCGTVFNSPDDFFRGKPFLEQIEYRLVGYRFVLGVCACSQ